MTRRLLVLNGMAAFMVAVHHAAAYGFSAMFLWTNRYRPVIVPNYDQLNSLAYYVTLLIRQVTSFAIPAFLFVSGYFIAFLVRGSQSEMSWNAAISRVKKLIVPFIIWTVIVFLLIKNLSPSLDEILSMYYYIPLIIQFYLLSPIIVKLAKSRWKLLLVLAAVLQFSIQSLRHLRALGIDTNLVKLLIDLTPMWFFPGDLLFFVIGVVIGIRVNEARKWLIQNKWFLFSSAGLFFALSVPEYELISHLAGKDWLGPAFSGFTRILFSITFVLCFLAFEQVQPPYVEKLSFLGYRSLGIYLVNTPAVFLTAKFLYLYTPLILGNQFLYQIILILGGLGIPLALMAVLSKSPARNVYSFVFG